MATRFATASPLAHDFVTDEQDGRCSKVTFFPLPLHRRHRSTIDMARRRIATPVRSSRELEQVLNQPAAYPKAATRLTLRVLTGKDQCHSQDSMLPDFKRSAIEP